MLFFLLFPKTLSLLLNVLLIPRCHLFLSLCNKSISKPSSILQGCSRRHLKEVKLSVIFSEQWLLLTIHPWPVGTRSIPTANREKVILAVMVKCMLANADSMSTSAVIFTHQTLHLLLQISIWLLFDHSNQGYLEGSQYICPFVLCLEVWKHDLRANVDWILKGLAIAGNMCSLWYAKLVIPSGKLFAF